MNRRNFLYRSGILAGAGLLGCTSRPESGGQSIEGPVSFDLHTHPGLFFRKGAEGYTGDEPFLARISEMRDRGLNGAFVSLVADWPLLRRTDTGIEQARSFAGDEGWAAFQLQLTGLKELLGLSAAKIALTADELSAGDQLTIYIACEGGDFLGGKIERIEAAYTDGLRSIQLVHYADNELGDLQTSAPQHNGMSAFGKDVVRKMNELGMVIDVAHASAKTVQDVVSISTAPVILSHSILEAGDHRPVAARAISAEHAKMIAGQGGVIGMWPSGFSTSFDEFVEHTLRMVDTVGIDHVGIGTDMDANYMPVIQDYTEFFRWPEALVQKGLNPEEVGKLTGGNARRVLQEVLG